MKYLLVVLVLAAGCRRAARDDVAAPSTETIRKDGFRLWREVWEDDARLVKAQAGFDLNCPAAQIELTVLGLMPQPDDWASDIGATGCGFRARYTRLFMGLGYPSKWILQSRGDGPSAPPPPPTPAPGATTM